MQWPASIADLAPAALPAASPREHQLVALEAIERWARTGGSRGQVIMACGTGKSLTEIWAAERLGAERVLVLVPTIPLVRQLAREWPLQAATERRLLRICSDKAGVDAEDIVRGDELGGARTTDSEEIAEVLRADGPLLVLCTYDSSPVLAEAMAAVAEFSFDLAIADEAHRCAGLEFSRHKTILNEVAIRATRRMFFTATPTVYGARDKSRAANKNVRLASMDDRALFGSVIHHLSFAQAIEQELLCPYQVAVIPIDDDEVHELIERRRIVTADGDHNLEAAQLATQIACARAMHRFGCRRIVAFHPSIAESKRFSEHFPIAVELLAEDEHPPGPIWSEHVDGAGMPHATRMRLLERFQQDEPDEHRLLSNVRLLTEGVDVPGIDAIAFIETRRGQGSIIQAVGRAVRPAPGKTIGTIILPIVLRKGESFDAALARSEHRSIVDILGALRSHDPDIIKSLDGMRFNLGPEDRRPGGHGRFLIDAPLEVGEEFAAAVDLALAGALGVSPQQRQSGPRSRPSEPRLLAEGEPPSGEELIEIAIGRLTVLGRWELLTAVPADEEDSFPMQACWRETKQRWTEGTLEEFDRAAIANSVSWLTPDLDANPRQQREMASITDADLPEQIVAQCHFGGRYAERFGALVEGPGADELVEALAAIQTPITHAAMSARLRLRYMLLALGPLTKAVEEAEDASPGWWRSWGPAAIDGFVYELQLAHAGPFELERPETPWTAEGKPTANLIGRRAAEPLAPLARRMRIYSSSGDREVVEGRLHEERSLPADERLDALGWEIFLLARARGDASMDAFQLAMEGNLHTRGNVHRDLRKRSLRELEK